MRYPTEHAANLAYLLSRINEVRNESCKRHYARILMLSTKPNAHEAVQNALIKVDMEPAIGQFFDWIIDPKVKVAVKVCAAEALFNMIPRYAWIKEELAAQLQILMRIGGPAIQARGKNY
ncbi:hypothetical protein [Mucilaginibacter segetis]|uniref:Uncharacterized protein n=1 Tax=Mucilaginibacter segetis TaxID=2793071 RepID=A0A934PTX8_9SPHI|nr:hypothetical protein [Mucilaginibacter segetis]MBK0378943.1 hypothetical protein [Mucilaginibacter segetis]